MKHVCKVTVLERKVFPGLQRERLVNAKSGPCPCFEEGPELDMQPGFHCDCGIRLKST